MSDRDNNLMLIKEAQKVAQQADIIILCLGGNEQTSREAWAENHMGDRTNLQLVGEQMELVKALKKTGKPLVSLLFNGKPLAISELALQSDALLECWYLGSECGNAVANVLSGEVNPSGKLPISIPRSVGHIPCYYIFKPTARRGYLFDDVSPLYPIGYGLSYTQFEYSEIDLSSNKMNTDGSIIAKIMVRNTGESAEQETFQLYIRDEVSSRTRPVKELKAFQKISLNAGESKTVEFTIDQDEFSFWNIDKKYTVEPGKFLLFIGSSSDQKDLKKNRIRGTLIFGNLL